MSSWGAPVLAALMLAACDRAPPPPSPVPVVVTEPVPYRYADERDALRQRVTEAEAALSRGPVVWPQWETLARAQLALAQLEGDYAGYLAAGQSLERAFALAGQGGPYLSRARYHFSVHRLDRVDADLDAAARENDPDLAGIALLRADLDFHRGRYTQALEGYRAALRLREDLPGLTRLALWHARMGHGSEAAALLDRAWAIYHGDSPHPRAWLALQRGLLALDRGDWDAALAHYRHALRLLPGWWLAREHVAEIHALRGETAQARAGYESVIADTGHPEFMDAMAELSAGEGRSDESAAWIARARAAYQQRLAQLPEASYGHGVDHFLRYGTPQEALQLARANHRQRPFGESQLRLAEALLRAGEAKEALQVVQKALASGWETAELYAVAARVFAATDRPAESEASAARARALNPHAERQFGLPPAGPLGG